MARQLPVVLAAALLFPQAVAAGEAPDQAVPCVGPMCMLTPIYKLRTMMPDMPASGEPTKPSQPPSEAVPQAPSGAAGAPADANETTAAAPQQEPEGKDAAAANDDMRNGGGLPDARSRPSRHVGRQVTWHSVPRRPREVVEVVHRNGTPVPRTPVVIAANATETDRLLLMASMVKTPRLQVVTSAKVNSCRQKPDFIVDMMSNPDRVGPAIPLFTEGLIIVARKDIRDLAGLKGRQVSFGVTGSSSQRVAQRIFNSLKVEVHEQPLDLDNALDALTLGSVDAVAFLAPSGFGGLAHHDPQLHILDLPDRMIPPNGLRLSRIEPASYLRGMWSPSTVSVVTVDAVLSPSAVAHMQPSAQAVYAALDQRAPELAANGFDLIGGSGLTTMRSSAKDEAPLPSSALTRSGC